MKAVLLLCALSGVILAISASAIVLPVPENFEDESNPETSSQIATPEVSYHGSRVKRSPLDPIIAPLLIGKSFLYGALLGPKLFRPVYYHHHQPYYGHGYGHGWGWGYGHGK